MKDQFAAPVSENIFLPVFDLTIQRRLSVSVPCELAPGPTDYTCSITAVSFGMLSLHRSKKVKTMLTNNLISLLGQTFPCLKKLFTSQTRQSVCFFLL